jgi:hypothetical protein
MDAVLFVDVVTREEFQNLRTAGMEKYFLEMKATHPKHRDRYSHQTWLPQRGTGDKMLRHIRRRYEINARRIVCYGYMQRRRKKRKETCFSLQHNRDQPIPHLTNFGHHGP